MPVFLKKENLLQDFLQNYIQNFFDVLINNATDLENSENFKYTEECFENSQELTNAFASEILKLAKQDTLIYLLDYRLLFVSS